MDAGYRIRSARLADVPGILEVERACFGDPWSATAFREAMQSETSRAFVAEDGKGILGFALARTSGPEAEILDLAVLPAARQQGIGRGLLRAVRDSVRAAGVSEIFLEVIVAPAGDGGFLGLGASPLWTRAETPVMPKGRYQIMAPYMDKVGKYGRDMMFRTCTVQVNLDFGSEADMVRKFRVSLALQPVATALFANSPFLEGKPNGFLSFRSEVWRDTDNARAGMLPFVFEEGMGFERYVDYALDVPMYFVIRDGRFINAAGESFRDFLEGRLPQLPGERPVLKDWSDHLTTIFPEVRLKKYLEMRGCDSGPWRRLCAMPALFVGLLYDEAALDGAWQLVKGWTAAERQALRDDVPRQGLAATIAGRSVRDVARDVLKLARGGLERRGLLGCKGKSEAAFLDILDETVASGRTAAENLLALYHGPWGGKIERVFRDFAY